LEKESLVEIQRSNPGIKEAILISKINDEYKKVINQMKATAAEINLYKYEINQAHNDKENIKVNLIKQENQLNNSIQLQKQFLKPLRE
jgi:septal ring factor EnvC (AmiA/AmiB activator)